MSIKINKFQEPKRVLYRIEVYENASVLYKGMSKGKWKDRSKRNRAYSKLISKIDKIIKMKRVTGYYDGYSYIDECRHTKTLGRAIKIAEKLKKIPEIRNVVIHEIKY